MNVLNKNYKIVNLVMFKINAYYVKIKKVFILIN